FQMSCQGATSITTSAVYLCDKIAPALRQAVCERTAKAIVEDVRGKCHEFNGSRAALEVCMLRYLAQEENFEHFKNYLNFPADFLQWYIKTRVNSYCLDGTKRLEKFLASSLNDLHAKILSAVSSSTQTVKDRKDREDKISLWLDELCRELAEVISLPRSDLKGLEHLELTDIEFLSNAMAEPLTALEHNLREGFADADMSCFEREPHTILAEQFLGCSEQCPFCGALCTNTMPRHDGDHQLVFHRPEALTGRKWLETPELVLDICSSSVASNTAFCVGSDTWIPYKSYRTVGPPYSTWNILPDSSMQAYWKWFVCRFQTELEDLYKGKFQGKGEIPEEWRRVTKQEALEELDK
ncbi:Interferon-induced very large GTPase 1, partial [Acanthisitta chloris]